MRNYYSFIPIYFILLLIASACSGEQVKGVEDASTTEKGEPVFLTISTAASLKEAIEEIQTLFEDEYPNITLNFNFGGSGSLQQQISQGAPVDMFFSAAEDKFHSLVDEGIIAEEDRLDLLRNELVLIVPKGKESVNRFEDIVHSLEIDMLSIGTPETVPAGKYAKEAFENIGIWEEVESKIIFAKDVRQVLSYVETGNVDAGIVYKTDALVSDKVHIVATADYGTHTPIIYPVGVMKNSAHYDEAMTFFQFLQSNVALEVFEDYGFNINK